jgi:cellobiose-specific phosphotransferase system component IIC
MGKFNDAKWRRDLVEGKLQDKVWDKISGMSINAYANVQHEFGIGDANEMQEFIEDLSDNDAKNLLKQIDKKMFESVNYSEGTLNEFIGFPGSGYALAAVIAFLIKWAKKNPKDVKKLKDKVNKEL